MKEKRWVEFKGEVDSTSISGADVMTAERDKYQEVMPYRKVAPTQEEMAMLEARRQCVKENVTRGDGGGDVGCGDGSRSDDGAGCGDDSRGGDDDDDSGVETVVGMVAAREVVMEMWCRMVVAAKVVAVVWQRW
ncbi:hypothetical protein Tco_0893015 [Tanacetum coccineum]|uniref:Uncharacterized protein n=1 Tax=Tanacetum coccineum TaxID=301880 RepID=A0ABQ5C8X0_9ASTR